MPLWGAWHCLTPSLPTSAPGVALAVRWWNQLDLASGCLDSSQHWLEQLCHLPSFQQLLGSPQGPGRVTPVVPSSDC